MDVVAEILFPFKWLVSAIMVGLHDGLAAIGMPAADGWTWTLAIVGLVLVIRATLIPVYLKQVKAQRRMRLLQPELKELADKYKGKSDPVSRQAMAQEQMALYKKHGTNPLSACLPLLIQVPFFFALFTVLSGIGTAAARGEGLGALSPGQVAQFEESSIFGAPLSATMLHGTPEGGNVVAVWILSIVMILAMTAAQFVTQKHIMAKARSHRPLPGPFAVQQKILLYVLPVVFGAGGIIFPIGVLIYWTTTNLWTMAQQFVLDPRAPEEA
ncbi:MAG: rane protein insertase YidC [Arthrobacter sp.]|nr:rane protein insertase YidC [Arthrobacter sp.]